MKASQTNSRFHPYNKNKSFTIDSKSSFSVNPTLKTIDNSNCSFNSKYNSWAFLEARRQSRLNSLFNVRKNRLSSITRANKAIYDKINTQQSSYSQSKILGSKVQNIRENSLEQLTKKSRELLGQREVLGPIKEFQPLVIPNKKIEGLLRGMEREKGKTVQEKVKSTRNKKRKQNRVLPQLITLC